MARSDDGAKRGEAGQPFFSADRTASVLGSAPAPRRRAIPPASCIGHRMADGGEPARPGALLQPCCSLVAAYLRMADDGALTGRPRAPGRPKITPQI